MDYYRIGDTAKDKVQKINGFLMLYRAVNLNDEVTKSIQTIYLWIEFAKDSIRRGILLIWVVRVIKMRYTYKTDNQIIYTYM